MQNEQLSKIRIIDAGLSSKELVELFKDQLPTDKQNSVSLIDFHKIKTASPCTAVKPEELLNES